MSSVIYDSGASIRQLLDRGFVMPIHFATVGVNGAAATGTCRVVPGNCGFDRQITSQTSGPEPMMAPVNIMYVDSRGEAAIVVVRQDSNEPMENPRLPSGIRMVVYD